MTHQYILSLADVQATLETVGGKGASLARLVRAGLPVPGGFHVTTAAYQQFVAENNLQPGILAALEGVDAVQPATLEEASRTIGELFAQAQMPPDIAQAIAQAYEELPGEQPVVAVRSSATAEDLPGASFAGQQETYLNIQGAEAVQAAVKRCWASLWTARAIGYRARIGADRVVGAHHDAPLLAVVVQLLVPADAAGILFTANPVTGQREQAMITASWGLGEAIVGGMVTPDTLTVEKASGKVLVRETADKQVMTVRIEGGTQEQPVPENLRRAPVLSDAQAAELVRLGVQIEQLYQMPMDIEWTLTLPSPTGRGAGGEGVFAIVQARPITALSELEIAPPTEWPIPDPKASYFRSSIVEQLPDPLTPLFSTLGRKAINIGTVQLFSELLGSGMVPDEICITINDYAYYQMRITPKLIWRMLGGMVAFWPKLQRSEQRWRDEARPHYLAVIEQWRARPLGELAAADLLAATRQLLAEAVNIYNVLQSGVLGLAMPAEAVFTIVYDRLIKRQGDPPAPTFVLGFDSLPILAEKSLYDLAMWCREPSELANYVLRTPSPQLANQLKDEQAPPGVAQGDWQEWRRRFRAHLQQYGHAVYDLDFSKPVLADDPTPLLETCKMYLSGKGTNPHERQQMLADKREQATQAILGRLGGLRLKLFRKTLGWGQAYAPMREDCLADIGQGYPLLRQMLRELGHRLVQAGMIERADDVYWLYEDEATQAADVLDGGQAMSSMAETVRQRKAVWRAEKSVTPPPALPLRSKMTGLMDKIGPTRTGKEIGDTIKGVGASPGCITATACVLHGPEDFDLMKPGKVLVAAITTPAWTPLFAMAAAIVTDVGGPLSHGSIVAREYGIPAVLGTGVATKRIHSGQTVTVDGSSGRVTLPASLTHSVPSTLDDWLASMPKPKGQYMRGSVVDILPDPLSPLFATWGLAALGRVGIKQVMKPLTRSEPELPDDYILTINSYAYMGVAYTPRQWWWILTRMLPSFPRIMREAMPLWRDNIRPHYAATAARWQARPLEALSSAELWAGAQKVNDAAMLHLAVLLVATTGASAGSEMLFTRVYEKMIRREGDPPAPVFLMGYNSTPIQAEKSLYDLAAWARTHPELATHIVDTPASDLAQLCAAPQSPLWQDFSQRFQAHLQTYGHIIYDLDFAKALPLDDPTPMLETIKMYLAGLGVNPHERQQEMETRRIQAAETTLRRLKGLKAWAFRKSLGIAQSLAEVRENALSDIGLGYPALRRMLRELGHHLVAAGTLGQPDDIYWLEQAEVEQAVAALERGGAVENMAERVEQRRRRWRELKRVTPPPTLPPKKKYMGIDLAEFTPAAAESQIGGTLRGVAASAGKVTAPARVLHGPEDFGQMRPGEVLVAATTTPAWTPLFAMASAVVTDIGGPLSHGSIVAREYGIPAVLGTGVATKRICSGQLITVDGSAGIVILSGGRKE